MMDLFTATLESPQESPLLSLATIGAKYTDGVSLIFPGQTLKLTGGTTAPSVGQRPATYTIKRGDTISGIAARTGLWPVTAWSVPSGNINRIWPGQTVTYRGNSTPTTSTDGGTRIHVVKSGETLSGIFGASGWQHVAQLNNLRNPNLIYPGQQLRY